MNNIKRCGFYLEEGGCDKGLVNNEFGVKGSTKTEFHNLKIEKHSF